MYILCAREIWAAAHLAHRERMPNHCARDAARNVCALRTRSFGRDAFGECRGTEAGSGERWNPSIGVCGSVVHRTSQARVGRESARSRVAVFPSLS